MKSRHCLLLVCKLYSCKLLCLQHLSRKEMVCKQQLLLDSKHIKVFALDGISSNIQVFSYSLQVVRKNTFQLWHPLLLLVLEY